MSRTALDLKKVRSMYEDQKMSSREIADAMGVGSQCIRNHLRRMGVSLRRRGPQNGRLHPNWRGGTTVDKGGYILRHKPDHPDANVAGYVREHRLVMEKVMGRPLRPTEVVHHIDDDPSNNSPSNLRLYESNSKHLAKTLKGKCPQWSEEGKARIAEAARKDRVAHEVDWTAAGEAYSRGLSLRETAEKFGVEPHLLSRRLKRLGIEVRRRGGVERSDWPSSERLAEMYKSMSMKAIAESLGVAESSVHRRLKDFGVLSRRRCDKAAPAPAKHP